MRWRRRFAKVGVRDSTKPMPESMRMGILIVVGS